jgi:RHS repeat-associated protein
MPVLASYSDNLGNSVSSAYSGDGLRRQRTNNSTTRNLTYDESILLLETDTSGNLDARYTGHPETWGGLTSQNRSGVSSFYGLDSQGSARILVSVGGSITDSLSWKAFGEAIQTGSGTTNPYGYVANAAYYTELADLVNAWNRWPRPSTGQWRSVDPIGFDQIVRNPYRYAKGNPISQIDPTGERDCEVKNCKSANKHQLVPCDACVGKGLVGKAKNAICNALSKLGVGGIVKTGCVTGPIHAKCLLDWCASNQSFVYCVDKTGENEKDCCSHSCSYSCSDPSEQHSEYSIYYCCPTKPGCANAHGCSMEIMDSILHEMIGVCGLPHDGGPADYPDPCEGGAACLCGNLKI